MGILGVLLGFEHTGLGQRIGLSIGSADVLIRLRQRLIGNTQRVGSHIGDQTHRSQAVDLHTFIQLLGHLHGPLGLIAQTAGSILLERGGDKGRSGRFLPHTLFDIGNSEWGIFDFRQNGFRLFLGLDLLLLAIRAVVLGGKRLLFLPFALGAGKHGVDGPVFLRLEGPDLLLPVHDHPHCHRLHPSGGKTGTDLFPQERTDLIAHDPVQHTAGLLGIHQLHIQLPGMIHTIFNTGTGDLIEGDPVGLVGIHPQDLRQMPGNRLSFPVRVGGQIDRLALFGGGFQLFDQILFALDGLVFGLEMVFHIHTQLAFGQIPDMAHGGHYLITAAQIFFDGVRLGRRLNDHKFRHFITYL